MFVKRCLSLVMIVLLAQPQILICADDLDTQDTQVVVCAAQDTAFTESEDVNQTPVLRTTTVTLPGGISINTDNSYVQLAIAVIALLGAAKYFGFIGAAVPVAPTI